MKHTNCTEPGAERKDTELAVVLSEAGRRKENLD